MIFSLLMGFKSVLRPRISKSCRISSIIKSAQLLIEQWRQHYNHIRPHSSLGYKPPAPMVYITQPSPLIKLQRTYGYTLIYEPIYGLINGGWTIVRSLDSLKAIGIIKEIAGKGRHKIFVYKKYFSLLGKGTE
jgi:hypothetical protein